MWRIWVLCLAAMLWPGSEPVRAQAPSAAGFTGYRFREPRTKTYFVEPPSKLRLLSVGETEWVRAWPEGSKNAVEFGRRIVLQTPPAADVRTLLAGRPLRLARVIDANVCILEAPDVFTALREASTLAQLPVVSACYPIARRPKRLSDPYAAKPNDPYFASQWYLENRRSNDGASLGPDLNVRAAWPLSQGAGITLAAADDGVETDHPDLADATAEAPHFNFMTGESNGLPMDSSQSHGTAVAGLAAARGGNQRGIAGVAPRARLASWVIFGHGDSLINEEQLMDMFQYQSNVVSIQNHSWGNADVEQLLPSLIEQIAISNAITFGRGGRGVIMVRSAGNYRGQGENANDDGYAGDPRVITVAAVRLDGRFASYSTPGACLLVGAPSGDEDEGFPNLFTTDRVGPLGYNRISFTNDLADYAFGMYGFSGTSASAPQISGLAALILSANSNLTYRDVQQILVLSSRHFDLADPGVITNGAGFRFSHNVGYGLPDAGQAVALARAWVNRPAQASVKLTVTSQLEIPDDGLRVLVRGTDVPTNLMAIPASPSFGLHPDSPTALLPLVDVGMATNPIPLNLTNKAALIQRGTNFFRDKINYAAQAGAAFAVVYNNKDGDQRELMGATEFNPIPAVFIGQNHGEALRDALQQNPSLQAQLRLRSASYDLEVKEILLCEKVTLIVDTDHASRGDVRITLVSPQGTRSVLQAINSDTTAGPTGWTYSSSAHFYECSAGVWRVFVSDERPGNTGSVKALALTILGVPIVDSDRDGLDDRWELEHLLTLGYGPRDDPDGDGYSNAREQIMGTDPLVSDVRFQVDLSPWDEQLARLSWASTTNRSYQVLMGTDPAGPLTLITNLVGGFPETEWFTPYTNLSRQFFRVRAVEPESGAR